MWLRNDLADCNDGNKNVKKKDQNKKNRRMKQCRSQWYAKVVRWL